jgi:hypothetical protein
VPLPPEEILRRELARLQRFKQATHPQIAPIGQEFVSFFKHNVQKRQTKVGKIAQAWNALVPGTLSEHCALESFTRGQLVVIVDSSSHLYEMKQLLLAGIEQQMLLACKGAGLRKISLKAGRWYDEDGVAGKRVRFDE